MLRLPRVAKWLGWTWEDLCNRHEQLRRGPNGHGRVCQWQDSSPLTVARLFPEIGVRLLHHVLKAWPIDWADPSPGPPRDPEASIILGVRGTARAKQLRACLSTLRAQRGISCEIIVVEQSSQAEFGDLLESDVRYVHQAVADPAIPFNRSWALNTGAVIARAPILVLFDGDMLLPRDAVRALVDVLSQFEAVRMARLIFYLDREASERVQNTRCFSTIRGVDQVVANTPNPIAIRRETYFAIGGHDEAFYGWGGEDNEFTDRLRTRAYCEAAFLPIVHLWHETAPNREGDRNAGLLADRQRRSPEERIQELAQRPFGKERPAVPWNGLQPARLTSAEAAHE